MKIAFQPKEANPKYEIAVIFYFTVVLVMYFIPFDIETYLLENKGPDWNNFLNVYLWPTLFFVVNLLLLFLIRSKIIVRTFLMVIIGLFLAYGRFIVTQSPNIVDPVYFLLISASCAITIAMYKGDLLNSTLDKMNKRRLENAKILDYLRDGYKYFLGKLFQGLLALGASLGVSMTILFKDGYKSPHLKYVAAKFIIGYIGICFGTLYWIGIPMLNGIVAVQRIAFRAKKNRISDKGTDGSAKRRSNKGQDIFLDEDTDDE